MYWVVYPLLYMGPTARRRPRKPIILLPCWLAGLRAVLCVRLESIKNSFHAFWESLIFFRFNEIWSAKSRCPCFVREDEECIDSSWNWICCIHEIEYFCEFSTAARSHEWLACNEWKHFDASLLVCNVYTHCTCIQNPMNLYTRCVQCTHTPYAKILMVSERNLDKLHRPASSSSSCFQCALNFKKFAGNGTAFCLFTIFFSPWW